jgi:hypothetical protein
MPVMISSMYGYILCSLFHRYRYGKRQVAVPQLRSGPSVNSEALVPFRRGGKSKFVPVLNYAQRHEDVWESGGIPPRILNLGSRWKRVVSFTSRPR